MILTPGDTVKAQAGKSFEKCHDGQDAVFEVVDEDGVALRCIRCRDEFSEKEYKSWGARFVKVESSERSK
jgi:hypothetical protein